MRFVGDLGNRKNAFITVQELRFMIILNHLSDEIFTFVP